MAEQPLKCLSVRWGLTMLMHTLLWLLANGPSLACLGAEVAHMLVTSSCPCPDDKQWPRSSLP